jgi:hypothetical protein
MTPVGQGKEAMGYQLLRWWMTIKRHGQQARTTARSKPAVRQSSRISRTENAFATDCGPSKRTMGERVSVRQASCANA